MFFETKDWKCATEVFWGEIAPCDHALQISEDNEQFIDTLEAFVTDGFHLGESVIIIATTTHLKSLNQRLRSHGHDLFNLKVRRVRAVGEMVVVLGPKDSVVQRYTWSTPWAEKMTSNR